MNDHGYARNDVHAGGHDYAPNDAHVNDHGNHRDYGNDGRVRNDPHENVDVK